MCARAGTPLSQADLDGACERHLRERFGERRDFAIENSLPTLLQDGLIGRDAQARPPHLQPMPLSIKPDGCAVHPPTGEAWECFGAMHPCPIVRTQCMCSRECN